jgi:predicted regulator of Ras-like GTPase activity (Roadblock/LC7/MglB family)
MESGDMIALPLNEILSRLPQSLAMLVLSRPEGTFTFPLAVALEQLRTGTVRITFAQLRQSSPLGTFMDNAAHDDSLIDLPMPLILAAIGPGALGRRSDQKRTEVPAEVTGVFEAGHGQFHRATVAVSARVEAPMASKPVALKAAPMPVPMPAPDALKPVMPVPFPAAPKPTTSIAPAPAAPQPPAPAPLPFTSPKPASPLPFAASAPTGEKVVTTIEAVSGAWPDPILQEIKRHSFEKISISIPVNRLEPGMKAGRIIFTWAEVGGWLSVPLPPSPHGQSQVELPLKEIAPLFLAKHRSVAPRKGVTIGNDVPDLFTGLDRPATTSVEVAPVHPVAPASQQVSEKISEQPSKLDKTPEEVTQQILALPGVAGALLASNDGLLVAGRLPMPLKAEMLAAFLPQIFTRVGECMQEVQLGTLHTLKLLAGQAPCVMFKVGGLYLAVLGQPGQTLPEPELERIAGELAQANS